MPLSAKQCEYLAVAWQCMESEPKIDYEKFKDVAGLASAHSARELLRVTKKKLKEEYGALGGAGNGSSTPSTPKTPGTGTGAGRKRATPGAGTRRKSTASKKTTTNGVTGDGDDGEAVGTPVPAQKKARTDSASPSKNTMKNRVKVEPGLEDDVFGSASGGHEFGDDGSDMFQ